MIISIIVKVIAVGLFMVFALYILIPWGIKIILRKKFLAIVKKSNGVCLTFDDGPNPESTPEILRLLKEAGTKATFFVKGENVERFPDLVSQIVGLGHDIGEHSYRHSHPWKSGPFLSLKDLIRGNRSIQRFLSPDRPALFRPPYGKLNIMTLLYIIFFNRQLVFWDLDLKDYQKQSSDVVLNNVRERLHPAAVVLLHDGRRNNSISSAVTVMAARSILQECANRGLTLITVSKALIKGSKKNKK